jgi:hypothetical protein
MSSFNYNLVERKMDVVLYSGHSCILGFYDMHTILLAQSILNTSP